MMLGMIAQSEEDLQESLSDKVALLYRYKERIPALPRAKEKDMAALYFLLIQAGLFGEAGTSTRRFRPISPQGMERSKGSWQRFRRICCSARKSAGKNSTPCRWTAWSTGVWSYGVDRLTSNGSGPSIDGKPAEPSCQNQIPANS